MVRRNLFYLNLFVNLRGFTSQIAHFDFPRCVKVASGGAFSFRTKSLASVFETCFAESSRAKPAAGGPMQSSRLIRRAAVSRPLPPFFPGNPCVAPRARFPLLVELLSANARARIPRRRLGEAAPTTRVLRGLRKPPPPQTTRPKSRPCPPAQPPCLSATFARISSRMFSAQCPRYRAPRSS